MILADLGADVVRAERPHGTSALGEPDDRDPLLRGRRRLSADLKTPEGPLICRLAFKRKAPSAATGGAPLIA
jgi:alpha-methylacyl-CoA racemase